MLPWQPARHQFCVAQDRVPGGLGPVVGPPCSFLGLILPTLPTGNRIFLGKAAAPLPCQRRTAVPCSRVSSDISIKGTGRHPWMLGAAGFRISLRTLPSCSPISSGREITVNVLLWFLSGEGQGSVGLCSAQQYSALPPCWALLNPGLLQSISVLAGDEFALPSTGSSACPRIAKSLTRGSC